MGRLNVSIPDDLEEKFRKEVNRSRPFPFFAFQVNKLNSIPLGESLLDTTMVLWL